MPCRRALRERGAQLLEASERLVGIADVEDLVVPDAIAVGHHDADEDVLERAAAVGHRPEIPYHLHTTVAAPGENPQRLAAHVGRESALRLQRRDPFVAGKHTEAQQTMVAEHEDIGEALPQARPIVPCATDCAIERDDGSLAAGGRRLPGRAARPLFGERGAANVYVDVSLHYD